MNIDGVEYMSVQEAADLIGVTSGRVRHLIYQERLQNIKIGYTNLVTVESVQEYIANKREPGRPPRNDN